MSHREDLIATQECFVDVVQETRVVLNVVVVEHVLAKREILVVSQNIQKNSAHPKHHTTASYG